MSIKIYWRKGGETSFLGGVTNVVFHDGMIVISFVRESRQKYMLVDIERLFVESE